MKRPLWIAATALALGVAALWAANELVQAHVPELPSLLPDGALLSIEAKDFGALLKDWNGSAEKRTWLTSDNYSAFSNSRLFQRLSQAQDEFTAAAGLPTDNSLLSSVAGRESGLALYDIGNLEFVYVTRMDEAAAEATPLWQLRGKFEQRSEGAAQFYVHQDPQSKRVAAFAARDGWLILGTREDLVAGVLARLESPHTRSLADDGWYAGAVKEAGKQGDLRMVLNLRDIVPSPYFRSYWVQHNISEMKQYSAAISDLYRGAQNYREERVLLRTPGLPAAASGDVQSLAALAPDGAAFYSAQASPDADQLLADLREDLLELKPARIQNRWEAPAAVTVSNAGSASAFEERIDLAPTVVKQTDAWQLLRIQLHATQPTAELVAWTTHTANDGVFASIDCAVAIDASTNWDEKAVQEALTAALQPGLTASRFGVEWAPRASSAGNYHALDGRVPLYEAVRAKQLLLATDAVSMEQMLAHQLKPFESKPQGITYTAVFRHSSREQQNFGALVSQLDRASHPGGPDGQDAQGGNRPAFFSGNIGSLSRMWDSMNRETVEEKDQGAKVTQTVVYEWKQ
jgi:hypothetical protein